MFDPLSLGLGAAGVSALLFYIYRYRLSDDQRTAIQSWISSQSPRMPVRQASEGNVAVKMHQWGVSPDLSEQHIFPTMDEPQTPYEDLNRRLIIFKKSFASLPEGLPPRDIADRPQTLECSEAAMQDAVERQLIGAYPVIFDPTGIFATASARLELNPFFAHPYVGTYLGLPIDERPVVISYDPPMPEEKYLTFQRYGFHGMQVPLSALAPYHADCFDYILEEFSADRHTWLWFSIARLRAAVLGRHKPQEAAREAIMNKISRNRFNDIWGIRDPEPVADLEPDEMKADYEPADTEAEADPRSGTEAAPAAQAAP